MGVHTNKFCQVEDQLTPFLTPMSVFKLILTILVSLQMDASWTSSLNLQYLASVLINTGLNKIFHVLYFMLLKQ